MADALPAVFFGARASGRTCKKPGRPIPVGPPQKNCFSACPLFPRKQTSELSRVMSALCQKRTLRHSCWHLVGLGLSGCLQDQLRDFLWVADQRKMASFHFDGLGPHALSHETLEVGVDRAIFCRHSVPTRL